MKKYFIVIVDDDPDDCEILATALKEGYDSMHLLTFTEPDVFLEFIELTPDLPSIIVLDMYMPKLNGLEVIEKMKQNPNISDIPIVILSSVTTVSTLDAMDNANQIKSFVKPISLMEYSVLADKIVQTIQ
jgi:CheY-like chemotaxis protein